MSVSIFGGIEGGASHSCAVLYNAQGEELAMVRGPHTNHWLLGMDGCHERIHNLVAAALKQANLPPDTTLKTLGLSLSGCEREETCEEMKAGMAAKYPHMSDHYVVWSDTVAPVIVSASLTMYLSKPTMLLKGLSLSGCEGEETCEEMKAGMAAKYPHMSDHYVVWSDTVVPVIVSASLTMYLSKPTMLLKGLSLSGCEGEETCEEMKAGMAAKYPHMSDHYVVWSDTVAPVIVSASLTMYLSKPTMLLKGLSLSGCEREETCEEMKAGMAAKYPHMSDHYVVWSDTVAPVIVSASLRMFLSKPTMLLKGLSLSGCEGEETCEEMKAGMAAKYPHMSDHYVVWSDTVTPVIVSASLRMFLSKPTMLLKGLSLSGCEGEETCEEMKAGMAAKYPHMSDHYVVWSDTVAPVIVSASLTMYLSKPTMLLKGLSLSGCEGEETFEEMKAGMAAKYPHMSDHYVVWSDTVAPVIVSASLRMFLSKPTMLLKGLSLSGCEGEETCEEMKAGMAAKYPHMSDHYVVWSDTVAPVIVSASLRMFLSKPTMLLKGLSLSGCEGEETCEEMKAGMAAKYPHMSDHYVEWSDTVAPVIVSASLRMFLSKPTMLLKGLSLSGCEGEETCEEMKAGMAAKYPHMSDHYVVWSDTVAPVIVSASLTMYLSKPTMLLKGLSLSGCEGEETCEEMKAGMAAKYPHMSDHYVVWSDTVAPVIVSASLRMFLSKPTMLLKGLSLSGCEGEETCEEMKAGMAAKYPHMSDHYVVWSDTVAPVIVSASLRMFLSKPTMLLKGLSLSGCEGEETCEEMKAGMAAKYPHMSDHYVVWSDTVAPVIVSASLTMYLSKPTMLLKGLSLSGCEGEETCEEMKAGMAAKYPHMSDHYVVWSDTVAPVIVSASLTMFLSKPTMLLKGLSLSGCEGEETCEEMKAGMAAKYPHMSDHYVVWSDTVAPVIVSASLRMFLSKPTMLLKGLSLSGCEGEETCEEMKAGMAAKYPHMSDHYVVWSDTVAPVIVAHEEGGVVLISGTGTNALLINPDGSQSRCGGWGFLLGDEGGAFWIAHKLIKVYIDEQDNLEQPPHNYSTEKGWECVKKYLKVENRFDLLPHFYRNFEKSEIAGLTRELAEVAKQGDPLCQWVFSEAGRTLAQHLLAISPDAHPTLLECQGGLPVVCVGSVWNSWELLKPGFVARLDAAARDRCLTEASLIHLNTSVASGATYLAAKTHGFHIPRDHVDVFRVFFHYQRKEQK